MYTKWFQTLVSSSITDITSRLTVVSHEAKKNQHEHTSSGPHDHYSELFTRMEALKFENGVTQPP